MSDARGVIVEEADIYQYPEKKDAIIPNKNTILRKGDAHGNTINLLHFLIRQNVIDLPDNMLISDEGEEVYSKAELYNKLVEIYRKDVNQLEKTDLDNFEYVINNLALLNPALLCLIGDELADRGMNDYFTLLIFKKLHELGLRTNILFSNHSAEAIIAFKNGLTKFYPSSYRQLGVIYKTILDNSNFVDDPRGFPNQDTSLQNMGILIEKKLIDPKEIEEIFQTVYLPSVKLIDYTINEKGFNYAVHAPIGLTKGYELSLITPEQIGEKIKIEKGKIYVTLDQNKTIDYAVVGLDGNIKSGAITKEQLPELENIKDPSDIKELNSLLADILHITSAKGHTLYKTPGASIEELAEKFGVEFHAESSEALKNTIDQLNEQFQLALKGENPNFKTIEEVKAAAHAAIWNRTYDNGEPHYEWLNIPQTLPDGTPFSLTHGHDGGSYDPLETTPENVINLDNNLGKFDHLNVGTYAVQIIQAAPQLEETKEQEAVVAPAEKPAKIFAAGTLKPKPEIELQSKSKADDIYARMKTADVSHFLTTIQNRMNTLNEPSYIELQKLLSIENTRKILKNDAQLFQVFSDLYARSEKMMADTLVAMDKQLYENIDSYEFFYKPAKGPAPNIFAATTFFQNTSHFIETDILSRESIEERTLALESWLRVADQCLHHDTVKSVNIAQIISSAINSSSIHRLKATFDGLTPHGKEIIKELAELTSTNLSYKNMREFMKNNPGAIPYTGVYQTDFTFIHDGSAYVDKAHQTFQSYANAYEKNKAIRENLQIVRNTTFDYKPTKSITQSINQLVADEDKAYQLSLAREPRDISLASFTVLQELNPYEVAKTPLASRKKETAAKIKTSPPRSLIILDEDSPFLHFTSQFSNADITIIPKNHTIKMPEDELAEKRAYYEANPIQLYTLVKYGKEMQFNLKNISEEARKKIEAEIKKPDFMDQYFAKAQALLEQDYLARTLLGRYNAKYPHHRVDYENVILIDQFAKDVYANSRQHLFQGKGLMDAPPDQKAMAIAYTLLKNPAFFIASDDSDNERLILKNKIDMTKQFIKELSSSDIAKLHSFLEQNKLFEKLPDELKPLIMSGEAINESKRMMQYAVDELYKNEETFRQNMDKLVKVFYTDNGTLKKESEFLNKDKKLSDGEKTLLKHFLAPYRVLAENHFGQKRNMLEGDVEHYYQVLENDTTYQKALEACCVNKADFLYFSDTVGGFKPADPTDSSTSFGSLSNQPIQRLTRFPLTTNELLKQKTFSDNTLDVTLQRGMEFSSNLAATINEAIRKKEESRVETNSSKAFLTNLAGQTRHDQNASVESAYQALITRHDLNPDIKNLLLTIKKYGLDQAKDDRGLVRAEEVSEILTHLSKETSTAKMQTYLHDKILHDSELHIHRHPSIFGHKETTLVEHLHHLISALPSNAQTKLSPPPPSEPLPPTPADEERKAKEQQTQEEALLRTIATLDRLISLLDSLNLGLTEAAEPHLDKKKMM